ncbi:MAG: DUF4147 domain-containing protein [Candidatus Nitrosocaldus sp.]|nr:DUF4147 domain-containing protein [Candidatus Nitrosocaldus sp.]
MYVKNRDALLRGDVDRRMLLLDAVEYMLNLCSARNIIRSSLAREGSSLVVNNEHVDIGKYRSIHVIGCGKAAVGMADAIDEMLGDRIASGMIIVPEYVECRSRIGRIDVLKGTHPIPSRSSVEATERMLELAMSASRNDLLLFLISGGCSSLVVKPYCITLEEKQELTSMLLASGARIDEINAVRKHLSQVKGGRLVEMVGADIVSLILSDVPCNRLDTIASGITAGDSTTFRDAMLVLRRYNLWERVSSNVRRVIEDGIEGRIRDTPKPGDAIFRRVRNFILADNAYACMKVREFFEARGIDARILSTKVHGEAREIGSLLASIAYEVARHGRPFSRPVAMIAGGESTVRVSGNGNGNGKGKGKGRGGRCQEMMLSALISSRMLGSMDWAMLAIGTDGIDGNSMNAGAMIDRATLSSATAMEVDMDSCLRSNDSAWFFDSVGDSIVTGPTGTNLNDVIIILV